MVRLFQTSARAVVALLLLPLVAPAPPAGAKGTEEKQKHADVTILIATEGHDTHWADGDDVTFLRLSEGGTRFYGTDFEVFSSDEALTMLLKGSSSGDKTRYIKLSLERDSISFGKVMKALERLKKAAPSEHPTVIYINPDPVYSKKKE